MSNQNIQYLLEQIFGPSTLINSNDIAFYCPKCKHHKKKLVVDITNQYYHCWVCHYKGRSLINLIKYSGIENANKYIPELQNELINSKLIKKSTFNLFEEDIKKTISISLPDNSIPILNKDDLIFKRARNYLINRGFSNLDMERYDIRYCIDEINLPYSNRIVFPSYDKNNRLNTFNSRTIDNVFPKYKEPKGVDKNNIIGLENFINWNLPIILVEGLMDAKAVKHNAIPLFGTWLGTKLKNKLIETDIPIYLCLDPEAFPYSIKIADDLLQYNKQLYFTKLPLNQDPSSLGYQKVWEYIKSSKRIDSEFLLRCKLFQKNIWN